MITMSVTGNKTVYASCMFELFVYIPFFFFFCDLILLICSGVDLFFVVHVAL